MHSSNPFSAPATDTPAPNPEDEGPVLLAERGTRLGAAMIDGLVAIVALIPAMIGGSARIASGSPWWFVGKEPASVVGTVLWAGLMVLQAYLVATSGQSIGKKLLGIKIVRLDGSLPGLVHGVLIRTWVIGSLNYIPKIGAGMGGLLALVDACMIFSDDRRCLHDRLAGTKVIVAKKPSQS